MRILFPLIFFVISGCALHDPLEVNLPRAPETFLQDQKTEKIDPSQTQWWIAFQDEQLNNLMSEVFSQNLELAQMYARLEQVEAIAAINQSALWPSLTAAGNAGRSKQPGLLSDFEGDSEQLSLQAGYEVDLWNKLGSISRAAKLDYAASKQEVQAMLLSLSARLADVYFLVTEQRAQVALADQLISSFGDTTERVERRYQLGLAEAVDLYQSRQSLSAAKASRHMYEASLAVAEHALSVLLGRYPEQNSNNLLAVLPAPPELFPVGIPADLISRRPDLEAALRRVESADQRVAAAIADRFPSISLSGTIGRLRQEVTGGLISGDFWSLLGNLALPVIDGGRRRAEVERNQALLAEAVAAYQQKVLAAFQDVEDALANNYAHAQRIEHLEETAVATGATLRLTKERYLAGITDYLPVLSAQRADFEVRSRLLSAQRQLLTDRISLARALGGTWMLSEMNNRLQIKEDSEK